MLKSLVPNLYLKMPLEPYSGPFSRNPTRLRQEIASLNTNNIDLTNLLLTYLLTYLVTYLVGFLLIYLVGYFHMVVATGLAWPSLASRYGD